MKKIILTIAFLISLTTIYGGVSYPKHQFGLGYSMVSGVGLEYQIEITNKSAFKTNFIAYYYGENPPNEMKIYDVFGLQYQYNLMKFTGNRLYAFAGGSYWHLEDRTVEEVISNDLVLEKRLVKMDRIWNFGTGIGYEILVFRNFVISGEIGALYQISNSVDHIDKFFDRDPLGTSFFGVGGGISLRFNIR